jgi:ribonuclease D
MAKGKVRLSNWNKSDLSSTQIKYAALDAYVSKIHDEFNSLLI